MTIRAAGYLRVSTDAQVDTYSLAAQERAITDACTARQWTLTGLYREEGISASSERIEKRPLLAELLDAVQRHDVDVVVVHSLDRWSRNVLVMLNTFRVLSDNHVTFVSLTESIDMTSPEGRLQLTILGAFASYFIDSLSKHTTKGKRERALTGLTNASRIPFGYVRTPAGVVPDPQTAPIARMLFERAAAGTSIRQLVSLAANAGHVTRRTQMHNMLLNQFYIGMVSYRHAWYAGTHTPLIDKALWQQVQDRLASNKRLLAHAFSRAEGHRYLFGGLLTCGLCGAHYHGEAGKGLPSYRCSNRQEHIACRGRDVGERALLDQIPPILARLVITPDVLARLAASVPAPPVVDRAAITARLERLRLTYELGDIDRERYLARRAELLTERDAVPVSPVLADVEAIAARCADVPGLWERGTTEERRAIMTTLFRDFMVENRRIVAFRPQPAVAPLFHLLCQPSAREGYVEVSA